MSFSITDILENPLILSELKLAWIDSEPGGSGGHEEGGFIVADDSGNLIVVRWGKGLQNEIVLPQHRNCFIDGKNIVASFHRHLRLHLLPSAPMHNVPVVQDLHCNPANRIRVPRV